MFSRVKIRRIKYEFLLGLVLSLSVGGSQILVSGLKFKVVLVFILLLLGCFIISKIIFKLFDKFLARSEQVELKGINNNYRIIYIAIIFGGLLLYHIAYNPAIMYWDSYYQVAQAIGLMPYDNWHPLISTFMIKLILGIHNSLGAVIVVQMLYWSLIVGNCAFWFAKKLGNVKIPITVALLISMLPNQALHIVTILKDTYYVATYIWIMWIILRLIFDVDNIEKYIYYEVVFVIVFGVLIRANGMVMIVGAVICFLVYTKFDKKMIVSVVTSFMLVLIWYGPIMHSIDQVYNSPGLKYLALADDLLYVEVNGGSLSEETEEMLNELFDERDRSLMSIGAYTHLGRYEYIEQIGFIGFVKDYVDTLVHNPLLTVSSWCRRLAGAWDLREKFGPDTVIGIRDYAIRPSGDEWIQFPNYGNRWVNSLTNIFDKIVELTLNKVTRRIFWRNALYLDFICSVILYFAFRRIDKTIYIMFLPIIFHIVGLALSLIFTNYRYFWPIEITAVIIASVFFLLRNKSNVYMAGFEE